MYLCARLSFSVERTKHKLSLYLHFRRTGLSFITECTVQVGGHKSKPISQCLAHCIPSAAPLMVEPGKDTPGSHSLILSLNHDY